ncbi:MAG TPA: hypothetical protein PLA01_03070 [Acetivibrio sp.]|nr:hypothetical protein [Acetivibrio sp.]
MEHFDTHKLMLYVNGLAEEDMKLDIENHLQNCDECLEKYIEAIEYKNVHEASALISPEFCSRVMEQITQGEEKIGKIRERRIQNKYQAFMYYVAAACITLIFMASGVFQQIFGSVSNVTSGIEESPGSIEKMVPSGWTDRLVEGTSDVIDVLFGRGYSE